MNMKQITENEQKLSGKNRLEGSVPIGKECPLERAGRKENESSSFSRRSQYGKGCIFKLRQDDL